MSKIISMVKIRLFRSTCGVIHVHWIIGPLWKIFPNFSHFKPFLAKNWLFWTWKFRVEVSILKFTIEMCSLRLKWGVNHVHTNYGSRDIKFLWAKMGKSQNRQGRDRKLDLGKTNGQIWVSMTKGTPWTWSIFSCSNLPNKAPP